MTFEINAATSITLEVLPTDSGGSTWSSAGVSTVGTVAGFYDYLNSDRSTVSIVIPNMDPSSFNGFKLGSLHYRVTGATNKNKEKLELSGTIDGLTTYVTEVGSGMGGFLVSGNVSDGYQDIDTDHDYKYVNGNIGVTVEYKLITTAGTGVGDFNTSTDVGVTTEDPTTQVRTDPVKDPTDHGTNEETNPSDTSPGGTGGNSTSIPTNIKKLYTSKLRSNGVNNLYLRSSDFESGVKVTDVDLDTSTSSADKPFTTSLPTGSTSTTKIPDPELDIGVEKGYFENLANEAQELTKKYPLYTYDSNGVPSKTEDKDSLNAYKEFMDAKSSNGKSVLENILDVSNTLSDGIEVKEKFASVKGESVDTATSKLNMNKYIKTRAATSKLNMNKYIKTRAATSNLNMNNDIQAIASTDSMNTKVFQNMVAIGSNSSSYNQLSGAIIGATKVDIDSVYQAALTATKIAHGSSYMVGSSVNYTILGSSGSSGVMDLANPKFITDDASGYITGIQCANTFISVPIFTVSAPTSAYWNYFSQNSWKYRLSATNMIQSLASLLPIVATLIGGAIGGVVMGGIGAFIANGVLDTIPEEFKGYFGMAMWYKLFGGNSPFFDDLKMTGWSWSINMMSLYGSSYSVAIPDGIDDELMALSNGIKPKKKQAFYPNLTTSQNGYLVSGIGFNPVVPFMPTDAIADAIGSLESGVHVI